VATNRQVTVSSLTVTSINTAPKNMLSNTQQNNRASEQNNNMFINRTVIYCFLYRYRCNSLKLMKNTLLASIEKQIKKKTYIWFVYFWH
jgi:hypothetical protein